MNDDPTATITLSDRRQLFVDDLLIERLTNVHRTVHSVRKDYDHPVLVADRPWEGQQVLVYGTVVRDNDDGLFKIWYMTYDHFRYLAESIPEVSHVCYAESTDGITWRKPELGVVPYRGYRQNNIVLTGEPADAASVTRHIDNCSVLYEPDDFARPYKMMIRRHAWDTSHRVRRDHANGEVLSGRLPFRGISDGPRPVGNYVLFSRDGVDWSEAPLPVMLQPVGDTLAVMRDTRQDRYLAFVKKFVDGKRARFVSQSNDFETWTEPELMLAADSQDPDGLELYANSGFVYQDQYLGFLTVWHSLDGNYLDVQLISSRDGVHWQRVGDRSAVITVGRPEIDWDFTSNNAATNPPIRVGDDLWVYYSGRSSKHLHESLGREPNKGAIGLGRLRLDGFVSLDTETNGEVLTRPLQLPSRAGLSLFVNADAGTDGTVAAELTDAAGRPMPGWSMEACRPLTGDAIRHRMVWNGSPDLPLGSAGPLRIRFGLNRAHLYSFQIT